MITDTPLDPRTAALAVIDRARKEKARKFVVAWARDRRVKRFIALFGREPSYDLYWHDEKQWRVVGSYTKNKEYDFDDLVDLIEEDIREWLEKKAGIAA